MGFEVGAGEKRRHWGKHHLDIPLDILASGRIFGWWWSFDVI